MSLIVFLIKNFFLLWSRCLQNIQIMFHNDWWIDFLLMTGWSQWVGFYSKSQTLQNQWQFSLAMKMQHRNGKFLAEFSLTIKYLINRKLKKQLSDTCPHKHRPEKTDFQRISFQEKEIKKLFFITLNNIFQQQIKETYQSTKKKLSFLTKKNTQKIFLNKK